MDIDLSPIPVPGTVHHFQIKTVAYNWNLKHTQNVGIKRSKKCISAKSNIFRHLGRMKLDIEKQIEDLHRVTTEIDQAMLMINTKKWGK